MKSTERQVNMFTRPSECASIWQTNIYIYIYLKVQKFSGDFWCMKFKVPIILKSKIPIQNDCQKKFQTISQNGNTTKFKMAAKKLLKLNVLYIFIHHSLLRNNYVVVICLIKWPTFQLLTFEKLGGKDNVHDLGILGPLNVLPFGKQIYIYISI